MTDEHATYSFKIAPIEQGRELSTAPSPQFMYLFSQQIDGMVSYQDQLEAVISMMQVAESWLSIALPEADPADIMRRLRAASTVGNQSEIDRVTKAIEDSGGTVVRLRGKETAH